MLNSEPIDSGVPEESSLTMELVDMLDRAAETLKEARSVLFITGAGMSADSGLPTYRGTGGLYQDRTTDAGVPIEVALSGGMFQRNPAVTWSVLLELANAARGKRPHRGHEILAAFENDPVYGFDRIWILTQNVDGFHQRAGSRQVIDIHGDLSQLQCARECGWEEHVTDYHHIDPDRLPPRCPVCNSPIRPNVVLFGELLPEAKLRRLQTELRAGFDLVVSIGTTSVFPYIAQPMIINARLGKPTLEINPDFTEVSSIADLRLPLGAARALVELERRLA